MKYNRLQNTKVHSESIRSMVADKREEIIKLTSDLIRFPTFPPYSQAYDDCAKYLSVRLSEMDFTVKKHRAQTNLPVCIVASKGKGTFRLNFHGHFDVVAPFSEKQFHPRIKQDRILGRGSADMKAGIAAILVGAEILGESDFYERGELVVSLTPDEETGGAIGTGYLMENKLIPLGIGMIMPEPTSGQVWDSCRGAITLEIMVKGKPAHSAQQHKGVNAFEKSIDLLYRLLAYKKIVETRRTELKISSEDSPHSIMMIGGICSSGNNFNVVPSEFKFSIDRRVNPEEKVELELEAIKNICRECEKEWFPIDIKILQQGDSVSPFKERRLGTILHQTISEYTGKIPDFVMCPGLLEIRHFVKAGIEAYAYGPGLLKQAHSSEESVKISEIQDTTGIFIQTALTMIERNYIF